MRKVSFKRPETAVDVFNLLPEGVYCQAINNVIYMSPVPSFQHQDIMGELFMQIRLHAKKNNLGACVVAPVDVFLINTMLFSLILYLSVSKIWV